MSFFDIIDRKQPKPADPKAEVVVTPMPRLSLDELEGLPADFDPRTHVGTIPFPMARKKPGRPPKAKP